MGFRQPLEFYRGSWRACCVYIDDILVTGQTVEDHLVTLEGVLERLQKAGLRLKKHKCVFLAPSVEYLMLKGCVQCLTRSGQFKKHRKSKGHNIPEVVSWIAVLLLQISSKRLHSPCSTLPTPEARGTVALGRRAAFQRSKELLLSSQLVAHFNPNLEIIVACDASAYGVGGVLSHKMPDGTENCQRQRRDIHKWRRKAWLVFML